MLALTGAASIWGGIATLGVIVVVGFEGDKGNSLGNAFLIFATLTWALLSVYAKKSAQELPVLTITTYAIFFAILFTTPVMIWESLSKGFSFKTILNPVLGSGVLYLGIVSTAIAFFLWNKGMKRMEAGIGALFFFFQPVVGIFLGWLILKESLTWNFFLVGLLILLGVAMVSLRERRDSGREGNCINKPQLVHSSTEAATEGGKVIAGKNA